MKERLRPDQLTASVASSTLNRGRFIESARFSMDKGQNEQPPRPNRGEDRRTPSTRPPKEASLGEFLMNKNPQAAREVARAMVSAAEAEGRELTREQMKFLSDTGYVIAGGADVPENEDFQPGRDFPEEGAGRDEERVEGRNRAQISVDGITNSELRRKLEVINRKIEDPIQRARTNFFDDLNEIYEIEGADPQELDTAVNRVREYIRNQLKDAQSRKSDFRSLSLQLTDMDELDASSTTWLNDQFNTLYAVAEQGAELESPQVQALQSKFNEAVGFLIYQGKDNKEVRDFQTAFNVRIGLLFGRSSVDRRSIEGIQGSVSRLGSVGLLTGFSLDEGRVGAMYNRMNEMVDDTRIREGGISAKDGSELHHLSPEQVFKLQDRLEEEQMSLAMKGSGVFGELYKTHIKNFKNRFQEDARDGQDLSEAQIERLAQQMAQNQLEADIRTTVRTAYDAFGVSQRQAVIAARGRQYDQGPYDFFTDPKSIFDMFNIEEFLTGKWKSLNHEQQKFFKLMKLDLARHSAQGDVKKMTEDQLLELGTRLFRDLFVVPDFFSSGWRIKGTIDQIENLQLYYAYNKAVVQDILSGSSALEKLPQELQGKIQLVKDYLKSQFPDDEKDSPLRREEKLQDFLKKGITIDGQELELTFAERKQYIDSLNLSEMQMQDLAKEAKSNSDNLALFMRLKARGGERTKDKEGKAEVRGIWEKIQTYRAEEMIKIVRERNGKLGNTKVLDQIDDVFRDAGIDTEEVINAKGERVKTRAYDRFKRDFGPVLATIREKSLRGAPPQPVDFRNLNPAQTAEINTVMQDTYGPGAASIVEKVYKNMYGYIEETNLIETFLTSSDYEDIYNRVITVDDTIMDQLDISPKNSGRRDGELSGYWSSERGGDALVRNYNDLAAAQKAGGALVSFLTTEGRDNYKKHAEEFAHNVMNYNGVGGAAKAFRYTYGSYLIIAEQDYMWDLIGIGKAPLRLATSEIERIFGPGADPLTREFLLKELDHISGHLATDSADHHEAAKYYNELMALLGTDAMSRLRDRGLQGLFYVLLLLMLAPMAATAKAVTEGTK